MELLDKIYNAGVVGAGGAGFPTHKKLVAGAEYLIINAAECEPLLNSDRYVCRTFSDRIIEALDRMKGELNISKVVIALKKKYTKEIEFLKNSISARNSSVEIFCMDSIYPAGDEQMMVFEVTGRTVPPGGIPIQVGCVVTNVTTVLNISQAFDDTPVTKKFVTVTGEVNNPVIVEVPVGISVSECIKAAGGVKIKDFIFIMGGPMMGKQYEASEAGNVFIKKTDGGIIILPTDHFVRTSNQISLTHMMNQAKAACIQCSYCTEMCPRYLIGHKLRPHKVMRAISTGNDPIALQDALLCCECGICEMYACPMHLSPRKVNIHIKGLLREQGVTVTDKKVYEGNISMRGGRKIPQSRLISRLDLNAYPHNISRFTSADAESVTIALKHGVGKAAVAVVAAGDFVNAGDLIGNAEFGDIAAKVHASISGRVVRVDSSSITIETAKAGGNS